jgi:uncharacterized protein with beta-barrel porin domain
MSNAYLKLFCSVSCLSLAMLTTSKVEAANIANGATVTAPPQVDSAMNFTAPAPGGTFVILTPRTFVGALTTDAGAAIGTLVLNSGTTYNGAVGDPAILQLTLNGNATIIGATGAQNISLGQNTLTNTGALNLPSGIVINSRVVSNALFGNVGIGAATDSIAGASVTVNVDASGVVALTPGAPLFIVSAGAGTSGLPVNVTSNSPLYSFIGNNLNGNITIIPTLNPVITPPGGIGSVFTGLLAIAAANPGSDIATVVAALSALPNAAAIASALAQFNPNAEGAIPQVSFEASKRFTSIFAEHMGYGRCIYATECDDCDDENRRINIARLKAEKDPCAGCFSEMNCENICNSYEVWADAFGYWGHENKRGDFTDWESTTYGGMLGFQAPVNQFTSIGIGAGYAQSWIDRGNHNDTTLQTYDGTLYVSYDPTHWYVDTAFSFDWQQYHDKRRIDFPGIDRTAKADYSGQEYSAVIATGYRFYTKPCVIFTPLASLEYSYLHVDKYHEHGAGDLDLHVKSQHYNFLESSLGLKISYVVQTSTFAFVPEVHALWLYDFFSDRMNLDATFSGVAEGAGSFKTEGPGFDRNQGLVGAGMTFINCQRWAIELVYNYQFSEHYHANEGLIKITKRF